MLPKPIMAQLGVPYAKKKPIELYARHAILSKQVLRA